MDTVSDKNKRRDTRRDHMWELVQLLRHHGKPIPSASASRLLGWPPPRAAVVARAHKKTVKITEVGRARFLSLVGA
jgi:hypothetical protein